VTEIGFYHLTRSTLHEALPRLLEKAYASGARVLVRGRDPERIDLLDRVLWTYAKESFLPHGTRSDGHPEEQPIYLTAQVENPNRADILVRIDEAEAPDLASFARCLDLFDGGDPDAVARARDRWRTAAAAGHACIYWQQGERGGWVKG
jgi:DNA polymerase-3 subunit chi